MRIREGFMLRDIAGETVVVPVGQTSLDFNGMITLNDTGAFLWRMLQEETDADALAAAILAEYDVDEQTARRGIERFIEKLRVEGLLAE